MDIKYLSYILEAYRCQSINRAAKNVFISQSHLSSIIKQAEQEVGYPIFIRTAKGLSATSEGRCFLDSAEKIVTNWERVMNVPQEIRNQDALTICCTPSSSVFHTFLDFKKAYPSACNDTFLESGLNGTIQNIVNQSCRIGILVMLERQLEKYRRIAAEYRLNFCVLQLGVPMHVYMARTHPLAAAKTVRTQDLADYPMVVDINVEPEDLFRCAGIARKALYVSDRGTTYEAICRDDYVMAGHISPKAMQRLSCVSKTLEDGETMAFCVIRPMQDVPTPRERNFLSYLQEQLNGGIL